MHKARTTRFAAFVSALAAAAALAATAALAQPGQGRGGGGFGIDARAQERSYRFTDTGEDLQYCLFKSSKVDAATPAPLIVSLHGLGAGPQVMCNSTAIELAEHGGYILVAPIGYNTSGWYGVPSEYRRAVGRGGRGGRGGGAGGAGAADAPANVGELSEKDVLNVLELVRKEFNVDPKRIYLTGHSMGAAGTVYLGSKHADVWAAIAPVAGGVRLDKPEILDPLKAAGIPVLLVIGDADEVVAIDEARAFKTKLEAAGIEHEYVELPGISHGPVITASQEHVYAFFAKHMK